MPKPNANISRLLIVVTAILIWQLLADFGLIETSSLSSPIGAATHIWLLLSNHGDISNFYANFYATLLELFFAYAIVAVMGVSIGLAIGMNKFLGLTLEPLIIAFFSIPTVVLYPIAYLLLGLGIASKVAQGILVGFFPVIANSAAGTKQVPKEFIRLGTSLGFSRIEMIRKILIPSALPSIATGLRLGLSMSLIGITAGEMIASTVGLGHLISDSFDLFRTNDVFALVFIVVGIATLGNLLLSYVEAKASRFRMTDIGK
ncbi:MAG: ABC transporter permease [Nitrososphaerota archaeon]|nr:ABC transporter permease [Nitrososphaerota archaeon]